ncbi:hypothetical protein F5I97DRAFT_1829623 [Phlebopus sp. FC_14]|nr:hypothetical protein F5I97DRAFT_1829623 [Phlebopus sp. FC_14]
MAFHKALWNAMMERNVIWKEYFKKGKSSLTRIFTAVAVLHIRHTPCLETALLNGTWHGDYATLFVSPENLARGDLLNTDTEWRKNAHVEMILQGQINVVPLIARSIHGVVTPALVAFQMNLDETDEDLPPELLSSLLRLASVMRNEGEVNIIFDFPGRSDNVTTAFSQAVVAAASHCEEHKSVSEFYYGLSVMRGCITSGEQWAFFVYKTDASGQDARVYEEKFFEIKQAIAQMTAILTAYPRIWISICVDFVAPQDHEPIGAVAAERQSLIMDLTKEIEEVATLFQRPWMPSCRNGDLILKNDVICGWPGPLRQIRVLKGHSFSTVHCAYYIVGMAHTNYTFAACLAIDDNASLKQKDRTWHEGQRSLTRILRSVRQSDLAPLVIVCTHDKCTHYTFIFHHPSYVDTIVSLNTIVRSYCATYTTINLLAVGGYTHHTRDQPCMTCNGDHQLRRHPVIVTLEGTFSSYKALNAMARLNGWEQDLYFLNSGRAFFATVAAWVALR